MRVRWVSAPTAGLAVVATLIGVGVVAFPIRAQPERSLVAARTTGASPTTMRAQTNHRPRVKVSHIRLPRNGRSVIARVAWNREMAARSGRHRFNIRLLALPMDMAAPPTVLHHRSDALVHTIDQDVQINLGKNHAKALRMAREIVFSVSQLYGRADNSKKRFGRGYVSTTHLVRQSTRIPTGTSVESGHRSWWADTWDWLEGSTCDQVVGVNVNMAGCRDMYGADLSYTVLNGANLANTGLAGARLVRASMYNTNLAGADLTRADLSAAEMWNANLSRADMPQVTLVGTDLYGATLIDSTLTGAICGVWNWPDGGERATAWPDGSSVKGPTCPAL